MTGRLFPIFLNLRGRFCLVVGAGKVGLRRTKKLLASGARVRLVAPEILGRLPSHPARLSYLPRPYRTSDLKGIQLAFACTSLPSVNRKMARDARRRGIWANRADARDSDFQVPAVGTRRGVTAAFSTAGRSPSLARRLRIEWARSGRRRPPRTRRTGEPQG